MYTDPKRIVHIYNQQASKHYSETNIMTIIPDHCPSIYFPTLNSQPLVMTNIRQLVLVSSHLCLPKYAQDNQNHNKQTPTYQIQQACIPSLYYYIQGVKKVRRHYSIAYNFKSYYHSILKLHRFQELL